MRIRQGIKKDPRLILSFMPGSRGGLLTVTSPAAHFAPIHSGRSHTKRVLSKLFSLFSPILHPSGRCWEKHAPPGELKCLWCFSHTEDSSTRGSRQGWSRTQTWNFFSIWKDFTPRGVSVRRSLLIINNYWRAADQRDWNRSDTVWLS